MNHCNCSREEIDVSLGTYVISCRDSVSLTEEPVMLTVNIDLEKYQTLTNTEEDHLQLTCDVLLAGSTPKHLTRTRGALVQC
jgi:hypothetical protein